MSHDPFADRPFFDPADESNPYAAPEASLGRKGERAEPGGQAEAIRRAHIQHEASVKSIGSLCYLGGIFGVLGCALNLAALGGADVPVDVPPGVDRTAYLVGITLFQAAFTALYFALGYGLQSLQNWARWTTVALDLLGLLGVLLMALGALAIEPVAGVVVLAFGGLIPGYILYLLLSAKAGVIFSPEYKRVIAQTPHVKYRTSCLVWGVLILLGVVILMAVLGLVIGAPNR